ncbi:hypothetical protein SLH49_21255 [Cognatiyoonia sp. IB215446]|uniref:hypothetical protein n=1 Tax=Cognatiyoonia sp. IB215446 TaxID=3097355 RepID=UPI002A102501|nr:hypothetical protein [Cognatiyoonia sp. IB215446]MDX8350526.1 hypothetical protein [Cognatiyoonia sp. IB215446]
MTGLALNDDETALLVEEGWTLSKTSDGPRFFIDIGQRQVSMGPVYKRNLRPKVFRAQASRYDNCYSRIAIELGWGGPKPFGGNNTDKFETDEFDSDFAKKVSDAMITWARDIALPKKLTADVERRRAVRRSLGRADLIDYAYLKRTEDLEKVSFTPTDDQLEYLSEGEDPELLTKAIEISKRRE